MSRYQVGSKFRLFAILAVLLLIVLIARSYQLPDDCRQYYRHDATIHIAGSAIKTEIADSDQELEKGLSGRICIGENEGMLFVFKEPGYYNFWMKDMKFPIDIVWVDANKRVIEVTDNIQPSTYPDTFISTRRPQYVLELKAGQAAKLGITSGKTLDF